MVPVVPIGDEVAWLLALRWPAHLGQSVALSTVHPCTALLCCTGAQLSMYHTPSRRFSGESPSVEVKKTTNLETNLHGLLKFANYSVQAVAFTSAGEGVRSEHVHCTTEQDVGDVQHRGNHSLPCNSSPHPAVSKYHSKNMQVELRSTSADEPSTCVHNKLLDTKANGGGATCGQRLYIDNHERHKLTCRCGDACARGSDNPPDRQATQSAACSTAVDHFAFVSCNLCMQAEGTRRHLLRDTFDWSIISSATPAAVDQPTMNIVDHSNHTQCGMNQQKVKRRKNISPRFFRVPFTVPGPPEMVKALAMTSDSILVAWTRPVEPNGNIVKYYVYTRYMQVRNKDVQKETVMEDMEPIYEARQLKEFQRYEFWVTAATIIGEGPSSPRVSQSPISRAPARIASFSRHVVAKAGSSLTLACRAVGLPAPSRTWRGPGSRPVSGPSHRLLPDHGLALAALRPEHAGNYTCLAENVFGRDEVTYTLSVLLPPAAPHLSVAAASARGLALAWRLPDNGGSPVTGMSLSLSLFLLLVARLLSSCTSWRQLFLASPSNRVPHATSLYWSFISINKARIPTSVSCSIAAPFSKDVAGGLFTAQQCKIGQLPLLHNAHMLNLANQGPREHSILVLAGANLLPHPVNMSPVAPLRRVAAARSCDVRELASIALELAAFGGCVASWSEVLTVVKAKKKNRRVSDNCGNRVTDTCLSFSYRSSPILLFLTALLRGPRTPAETAAFQNVTPRVEYSNRE
ncbi:hypothetical protein PR048_028016 [Dryococelus australis]|uniref:Down syndrome cell adhesion molecule-like protein Dscam2 n=1 Tax=Dryococelus australis TaxID=614101 RepID=A0ABQ9GI67_9NEOP|nr:hypothetical protein PR048_028016 [Dryococelus australis]